MPKQIKKTTKENFRNLTILTLVAVSLLLAVWKIFYTPSGKNTTQTSALVTALRTDEEKSLSSLLSKIDGVGEADVRICTADGVIKSVVVVCDGAKSILVNLNVKEAVATATGIDEKHVKIYQKSK